MNRQLTIFDVGVEDTTMYGEIRKAFEPALSAVTHYYEVLHRDLPMREETLRYYRKNIHHFCASARRRLEEQGTDYKQHPHLS